MEFIVWLENGADFDNLPKVDTSKPFYDLELPSSILARARAQGITDITADMFELPLTRLDSSEQSKEQTMEPTARKSHPQTKQAVVESVNTTRTAHSPHAVAAAAKYHLETLAKRYKQYGIIIAVVTPTIVKKKTLKGPVRTRKTPYSRGPRPCFHLYRCNGLDPFWNEQGLFQEALGDIRCKTRGGK